MPRGKEGGVKRKRKLPKRKLMDVSNAKRGRPEREKVKSQKERGRSKMFYSSAKRKRLLFPLPRGKEETRKG